MKAVLWVLEHLIEFSHVSPRVHWDKITEFKRILRQVFVKSEIFIFFHNPVLF